jgi:predicted metal-dependent HD superfamily phosphohydrolase
LNAIDLQILKAVETFVRQFFKEKMPKEYVYHDLTHTEDVVRVASQLALSYSMSIEELEILQIAAWFHDTGYTEGPEGHEERSVDIATAFLNANDYAAQKTTMVAGCIRATKLPQTPQNKLQQIICDADLSHLGEKTYWLRTARLRQELVFLQNRAMNEEEWIEFELSFMLAHQFHTEVGRETFDNRKFKYILQLRKQQMRLDPERNLGVDDILLIEEQQEYKKSQRASKEGKNGGVGRGVETMYRTTYNTHNNLSALADHKANLMLSVNTIIITITLSILVPQLGKNPQFVFPTIVLLSVCILAIVFATLSTRPKVTQGEVTLDDIRNKRSNLLFFGNFHNMKLEDFQWGMIEMIKDTDFQYSSMTRDLYYLGKVLAKKYRYLTYCYNIFMFGLILSVVLFAFTFARG